MIRKPVAVLVLVLTVSGCGSPQGPTTAASPVDDSSSPAAVSLYPPPSAATVRGLLARELQVEPARSTAGVLDPAEINPGKKPAERSLAVVTDPNYGREDASGVVKPFIKDRLVWISVYRDVTLPFGGPYLTPDDKAAGKRVPEGPFVVDLYTLHDARTGKYLQAGSLN